MYEYKYKHGDTIESVTLNDGDLLDGTLKSAISMTSIIWVNTEMLLSDMAYFASLRSAAQTKTLFVLDQFATIDVRNIIRSLVAEASSKSTFIIMSDISMGSASIRTADELAVDPTMDAELEDTGVVCTIS